ncbi:YbfB/YjiJ family MFS transporter, partial [Klebsiella pneumoniae]
MNNQSRQALWLALAGSIVLMIGMGYGRFAFTGVLPLMLNEGLLTLHEGNLAASANYAGYLVGALLLARVQPGAATRLSIISAGLTIASLALLAWVSSPWTIITLRAVAGALSAITLIAGSLWLLEHMGHHHGAPLLYAGVGLGIFISAEGIALGHALSLTSQQIWLLCALCAGLLLALAIRWLLTSPTALVRVSHVETSLPASGSDTRRAAWRLLMVYGLAGFGY